MAAIVRTTVTTRVQVNGLVDSAAAHGEYCVTGLVRPFVNLKPFSAELEHFWHKRHAIELAVGVEGLEDFLSTQDFHPVAYA